MGSSIQGSIPGTGQHAATYSLSLFHAHCHAQESRVTARCIKDWHCKTVIQDCHDKILTSTSLASRIPVHDTLARVHKALKFWSAAFICFGETNAPLCNWHTTLHKKEQSDHYFNKYKNLIYNSILLHRHDTCHSVCLPWIIQWGPKNKIWIFFFNFCDYEFQKILPLSNINTITMAIF